MANIDIGDALKLMAFRIIKIKEVNIHNLIIFCFDLNKSYDEYVDTFNYADGYFELGKDLLTPTEYKILKGLF